MAERVETPESEILSHGAGGHQTDMQAALSDASQSALRKYQDLILGTRSWWALVRYELLTLLIGSLPGALGLVLRQKLLPGLFGSVGRNVVFGRSITIRHGHKIRIGDGVVIDDFAVLDAKGSDNRGIEIGDHVILGRGTVLSCKNGDIRIGDNANIAMGCFIQSARAVEIGANVLFAAFCYVVGGGDHRTDRTDVPIIAQGQIARGIAIEDNCWIGAGVKVLDGTTTGRDSIVGSNAVVSRSLPPFSIAVGVPARVVRSRLAEPEPTSADAAEDPEPAAS